MVERSIQWERRLAVLKVASLVALLVAVVALTAATFIRQAELENDTEQRRTEPSGV